MTSLLTTPARPECARRTGATRRVLSRRASVWHRLSPAARARVVWTWRAATLALLGAAGVDVVTGWGYTALPHPVPGGAQVYAAVVAVLVAVVAYGWGQHQLGRGRRLRLGLALLAGWYLGWLALRVVTCVVVWRSPALVPAVAATVVAVAAMVVARLTPPDWRG